MKLNINTDFTKFPRAVSVLAAGAPTSAKPYDKAVLPHDERHLRRRAIETVGGDKVLVDLPEPVALDNGDRLVLEDGRQLEIVAAPEEVYDIRARDAVHLTELAWHIGNRHLAAAIEADRILILRDHVIKAMLEGLGAKASEVSLPFSPVRARPIPGMATTTAIRTIMTTMTMIITIMAHDRHHHGHHHHDD
ncbi:urease accessory protein UreE [Mesorhizobium atlanticum]